MRRLPSPSLRLLLVALAGAALGACGQCGAPADGPDEASEPEQEHTERDAPEAVAEPALIVDGEVILDAATLAQRVQEMVDRYERVADRPETTPRWRNQRRRRIVQDALHEHLVQNAVRQSAISVTDEQLDAALADELGHIHGQPQLFARYLESRGLSEDDFLAQRRGDLAEAELLSQRGTLNPSDEELLAFYEDNRDRWRAEERAHASTITIRVPRTGQDEQEERARERLVEARQRVLGGEDFAEVARSVSMGPERPRGGDMGWVMRGRRAQLAADGVEDLLFDLPVGQVSDPLRTQLGYQIFVVHDRRQEGIREFDEVRDNIVRPLSRQIRQRLRLELVRELEDGVRIEMIEDNWGIEEE